jgi:Fungal specific transcription factor domain
VGERRPLRSRPRAILPNSTLPLGHGVGFDNEDAPATPGDPPIFSSFQIDFGGNSNFDWWPGLLQDPMLLFDQNPSEDELMAQWGYFSNPHNFASSAEPPNFANPQAELPQDITSPTSVSTSRMRMLDLTNAVHPIPGLLAQFTASPGSVELSPAEHYALYYYKTTLSLSHTTKDPTWSTSMVFLRLGSKRPLVMRLLLAASLNSLVSNQEVSDPPDMLVIAKHHFQTGEKLLTEQLGNQIAPDHVNVMTAFWFLYLYRSRQSDVNVGEMTQLSQKVGHYVRKHELDRLCTDSSTDSASGTCSGLSHRKRSLLARLLIWIFYVDVSLGFRNRGGSLAKYLSEDIERMDKVYKTSKSILHLHWGSEYPPHQLSDDVQNCEVLEMLYKTFLAYHAINELSDGMRTETLVDESIERKLIDIEENYSSIFLLANSSTGGPPRLLQNAEWVVSLFYAIRIYYFRCTNLDAHAPRPPIVEKALSSLIGIVYRTYTSGPSELYGCPQWPLLIAGAETSDPIHRDWILKHMSPDVYKKALENIVQAQKEIGGRIGISQLREICGEGGSDGEVQRGNVKRIGFGAWC